MALIKRILLADDDSDDATLFAEALSTIDPSICCELAENGEQVINVLSSDAIEKPQIIILDLNMPAMDGWECLEILKKHNIHKDIPVMIYSTSSNQQDIHRAFGLGAFCFITKPDQFKVLKSILSILVTTPIDDLTSALKGFGNVIFDKN